MKKAIKLFVLGGALLLLGACENDKFEQELPVVKDNVSFALDIQPILNVQCAGCHNPAIAQPDLRAGFAYSSLMEGDEQGIIPGDSEGSEISAAMMFAAARYNAFEAFSKSANLTRDKEDPINWYTREYKRMLEANIDDLLQQVHNRNESYSRRQLKTKYENNNRNYFILSGSHLPGRSGYYAWQIKSWSVC